MKIKLGYSRQKWESGIQSPIYWDSSAANGLLISGQTGGGKSIFISYILSQILSAGADVRIFDFKAGGEYSGILPSEYYAEYLDCNDLLESVYQEFLSLIEQKKNRQCECYIVIDEFSAWSLSFDNKAQKTFLAKVNHIAILGRSRGYRLIISMQQANSQVIDTSIREQLPVRVSMARSITKESAGMMFPCEIPFKQPLPARCGLSYTPDQGLQLLQVPFINPEKIKKLLISKGKRYFE